MQKKLSTLLNRPDIWQGSTSSTSEPGLATGYAALDKALHRHGWPTHAIVELLCDHTGIGELQILLPALAKYTQQQRQLVFISPPHQPYAPALHGAGVLASQTVVIQAVSTDERLWAADQLLRTHITSGVVIWLTSPVKHQQLRKLQLAAQANKGLTVLLRPRFAARETSPAALRIDLSATTQTCVLHILKQRGGLAGQIIKLKRPETLITPYMPVPDLPVHAPARDAQTKNLARPTLLPADRSTDTDNVLH